MKYVCLPNESACWLRPHGIQRVSVRAWEEKHCFQKMFLKNNNKLFCNEATKDQDTEAKSRTGGRDLLLCILLFLS